MANFGDLDHINVDTVPTPNPDALMFRVTEALVPGGTYEYSDLSQASDAPLAQQLLSLSGVELILIAPRFVTVRKAESAEWPDMVPSIKHTMRGFLQSGDMAVLDAVARQAPGVTSAVERRILEILDDEIRPAIARDGGDVTYMGFVDGVVSLRLIGACGTCPSSTTTLKMGIEALLKEEIPEVREVVSA